MIESFEGTAVERQDMIDWLKGLCKVEGKCWILEAEHLDNQGYGYKLIRGKHWRLHRLSYTLHRGEFHGGYHILHSCDRTACVNPDHLRPGTPKDNVNDAMKRGRMHNPPSIYTAWAKLAVCATLLNCGVAFAFSGSAPKTLPDAIPSPSAQASPVANPTPSTPGKIDFKTLEYYSTAAERAKIASAGRKLNEVFQSKCFADFMLSRKMIQTGGRTPAQVVAHLQGLTGTVPVKFYYARFSSAVAYRQPPSMEINFNRKFLGANSSDCDMASTQGHESGGHSLGGYDHDYNWNAQRDYSVPYSINKAFEHCCK